MATTDPTPATVSLPPGVWLHIIQQLPNPERHALLPGVCKAWRSFVLSDVNCMSVMLASGRAAVSFGLWLKAHGHQLKELHITDHFYCHTGAATAGRLGDVHRVAMLQGLQAGGRALPLLSDLMINLDEVTAADAVCLGLINAPQLTCLELDSNGSSIGVTGAQGLAPLTGLKELMLPTQGLGDQGLQIIGTSLTKLEYINLHNDGHVTDDGLPYLSSLSLLTRLDLQGSISITNHGMLVVSQTLPQLQDLNISWCAGVTDWGLLRLCHLTNLTSLIAGATDITLESSAMAEHLRQLSKLKSLHLDRCAVQVAGLAAMAGALTGLQCLSLEQNRSLTSFAALKVLKQLSCLTYLDVSWPRALVHPDLHLTTLFELTQLQELVAADVLGLQDWDGTRAGGVLGPYPPLPTPTEMADFALNCNDGLGCLPFASSSVANKPSTSWCQQHHHLDQQQQQQQHDHHHHQQQPQAGAASATSAGAVECPSTAVDSHHIAHAGQQDHSMFWWRVLRQLACMSNLKMLNFRSNLPGQQMLVVLLVRGLALVEPRPRLEQLRVTMTNTAGHHGVFQVCWQDAGLMWMPKDKLFASHVHALASLGRRLADSINLRQLSSFCESQTHLKVAGGCGHATSSINIDNSSGSAGNSKQEQGEKQQQPPPCQQQTTQETQQEECPQQLVKRAMQMSELCKELHSMKGEAQDFWYPGTQHNLKQEEQDSQLQEASGVLAEDALSLIKLLLPSLDLLLCW